MSLQLRRNKVQLYFCKSRRVVSSHNMLLIGQITRPLIKTPSLVPLPSNFLVKKKKKTREKEYGYSFSVDICIMVHFHAARGDEWNSSPQISFCFAC